MTWCPAIPKRNCLKVVPQFAQIPSGDVCRNTAESYCTVNGTPLIPHPCWAWHPHLPQTPLNSVQHLTARRTMHRQAHKGTLVLPQIWYSTQHRALHPVPPTAPRLLPPHQLPVTGKLLQQHRQRLKRQLKPGRQAKLSHLIWPLH